MSIRQDIEIGPLPLEAQRRALEETAELETDLAIMRAMARAAR